MTDEKRTLYQSTAYEGDDRRGESAMATFQKAIESHMAGFHRELELHTSNNDSKMQTLVDGQIRTDENLQKLHDDQLITATKLENIDKTMEKMEKRQDENSGEIRELKSESESAKSQRSTLFNKVDVLELNDAVYVAKSKAKRKVAAPSGLLASKYIQASISIVMVLVVIGIFRIFGDIDVAGDASSLLKPTALTP
jgi:adenine-specific DNA methylase